jgi:hypothetical protein
LVLEAKRIGVSYLAKKMASQQAQLFQKGSQIAFRGSRRIGPNDRTLCRSSGVCLLLKLFLLIFILIVFSVFHIRPGPGKFFTTGEKAIWRNLAAWAYGPDEWVDLPGPAQWWPDDIDSTGFIFSDQSTGHKEAMLMVENDELLDEDLYYRLFPSHTDLRVMEDNSQSRLLLKSFFGFKA